MLLSNSRQFLFCFLNLVSADADSSTFSHSTTSSELAVATTVSTPACSNNVTISLPSFPIIFPLGVSSITQTLPIDISGCSDSVSSCLLSTSDTNIRIVSSTSIQLFPNQTTGPVSSQISCQQGSSNASFVFYIVNPKNLQKLAQVVIPSVSDCITTRLDTAMLNVTDDGGVLNSMIRIIPSAAVDGDILQVSTPVPGFPSGAFSMQSIIDGHVSVSPTRLNTVGQIKSISIPIVISDPSGSRNIRSDVKFTVMHTFCPLLKTASVLRSYQGAPVIFNSSHVSIVEPHGLSLWDFEWMIPVVKHGVLEYYCPDVYCTPTPPKWLSINSETSIIKQVYLIYAGMDINRWVKMES